MASRKRSYTFHTLGVNIRNTGLLRSAQGRAFEVQVCLYVGMLGGTGEEQCGAQGPAFEVQVCLSVAMSYVY